MPDTKAAHASLYAALAAFQKELPTVAKAATAKIEGRDGKQGYKYDYAPLEAVAEKVMPLLGKHGLSFSAWPTMHDGNFVLRYCLWHESGADEREGFYPLPDRGTPQDLGKAISYARRYCLCAVTGVAPGGDDNDAQGVPSHPTERPRQRPTAAGSPTGRSAAAPAATSSTPAHGSNAAEAPDDPGWGDWPSVIDAITSVEDAEAAKDEIDKAVAAGRMNEVKATAIKRAMTVKGNTAARQGGAG